MTPGHKACFSGPFCFSHPFYYYSTTCTKGKECRKELPWQLPPSLAPGQYQLSGSLFRCAYHSEAARACVCHFPLLPQAGRQPHFYVPSPWHCIVEQGTWKFKMAGMTPVRTPAQDYEKNPDGWHDTVAAAPFANPW